MKIKPKRFRLLTILLTAVMLVALSLNVMAAKGNAVTRDGLTAQLFTDKDSYKTGESVKASVQVDNHTGREVFVFAQINAPEGVKLASDSTAFDARLQNGETWTTPGGVVSTGVTSATSSSTATGDNMQAGFWVILTLLAVCGIAALFVYGKNKTTWLSIMLCIAMVGGMVAAAIPVQAADMNGDIQLSCTIQVDGKDAEVSTTVSYVIYDEAEEEAEESTEAVTPSEPSDSSDTSEPSDSSDTSEPSDSGDASEPSDSSDASEPSDSSDTSEPSDSSDTSEPSDSDNTPEQNVKVYYYNDFEDPEVLITDNAKIIFASPNKLERVTKDNNSYLELQYNEANAGLYFQPQIASSELGPNYIFEMSLSTNDAAPYCLVQYKYGDTSKKNDLLIINGSTVKLGDYQADKPVTSLESGKWAKIGIKLTHTTGEYSVYLYDQESGEWEYVNKHTLKPATVLLEYLRIYFGSETTGTLCVDDIAIYEGDEFMDVSDMEIIKGTIAQQGKDVAMDHPELADIGNGIVVMAGETSAYANGQAVTINNAVLNTAGDDIIVPASFIETYLGVDVDGDTAELGAVANAAGKNVVYDSRGLVVITDSDISLNAEDDIKLLTMLAGYLQTGEVVSNYAAAPVFTQSVIDEAIATYEASWLSRPVNKNDQEKAASALYYLTLISRYYPEAKHSKTGETAIQAAVDQIEHLLDGGNEPFACVGPYWGHAVVAASMVLIQETPAIYNQLATDTDANGIKYTEKMDWLMKALAISGNWGFNDGNNYNTGVDLLGNFGKDYNPNYRNTYLSIVLSAAMYFEKQNVELDSIFTGFDYDTYMAKLQELGFTNIIATWSATDDPTDPNRKKTLMETGGECIRIGNAATGSDSYTGTSGGTGVGVKAPFVYTTLEDSPYMLKGTTMRATDEDFIQKLFMSLINFTYRWTVTSDAGTPGRSDYCYILSGKESPYVGQMGMMMEFNGVDGNGNRSRTQYAYDSWEILVPVYANMKLLGYWDSSTETMCELDNRIYVGNEDLLFKLQEGYRGYSSGSGSNEYEYTVTPKGHKIIKDIWYNFHCMLNTETTVVLNPVVVNRLNAPMPAAEPKEGTGEVPEGTGIYPAVTLKREFLSGNYFAQESYYPLDSANNKYESASVSFDIVMGNDMDLDTNDCVFMLAKKEEKANWNKANMLIQFNAGWINIYNDRGYVSTGMRFEPNYRYHVEMSFNVVDDATTGDINEAETYTVKIEQTWPTEKSDSNRVYEYTATDFKFRATGTQIDYVDSIAIVKSNEQLKGWVENVTVTGTPVVDSGDDSEGGNEGGTEGDDNEGGGEPVVYYQNDYEGTAFGDANKIGTIENTDIQNTITQTSEGGYLELVRRTGSGACRIQPKLTNVSLDDKLIVEIDLSTDNESSVPTANTDYYAYLQYKYNGSTNDFLFYIYSDNTIRVKPNLNSTPVATLTAGTWTKLRFVINPTTGKCDVYAYNTDTSEYEKKVTDLQLHTITTGNPTYMRLNLETENRNLYVDNFKIYNGDIESSTVTKSYYENCFDIDPETGNYKSDYTAQNSHEVNYIPVNKYLDMKYVGGSYCRLQPTLSNVSLDNELIVDIDLSPDSVSGTVGADADFYAYMEYLYDGSKKDKLFYIYDDNAIRMTTDRNSTPVATLTAGTWTKLRFVIDPTTGKCDVYVYNTDTSEYEEKVTDFQLNKITTPPTYMRLNFNGTNSRNLYVDNFKIYPGNEVTNTGN